MSTFYRLSRIACASVFVSFLMMQFAYAAASGTIVGRVVDRATGDPLDPPPVDVPMSELDLTLQPLAS